MMKQNKFLKDIVKDLDLVTENKFESEKLTKTFSQMKEFLKQQELIRIHPLVHIILGAYEYLSKVLHKNKRLLNS